MVRLIARPIPIPSARVLKNGLNTCGSFDGGIPSPLSTTVKPIVSAPVRSVLRIKVGRGGWFARRASIALRTRLTRTYWTWTGSPETNGKLGARSSSRRIAWRVSSSRSMASTSAMT